MDPGANEGLHPIPHRAYGRVRVCLVIRLGQILDRAVRFSGAVSAAGTGMDGVRSPCVGSYSRNGGNRARLRRRGSSSSPAGAEIAEDASCSRLIARVRGTDLA